MELPTGSTQQRVHCCGIGRPRCPRHRRRCVTAPTPPPADDDDDDEAAAAEEVAESAAGLAQEAEGTNAMETPRLDELHQ